MRIVINEQSISFVYKGKAFTFSKDNLLLNYVKIGLELGNREAPLALVDPEQLIYEKSGKKILCQDKNTVINGEAVRFPTFYEYCLCFSIMDLPLDPLINLWERIKLYPNLNGVSHFLGLLKSPHFYPEYSLTWDGKIVAYVELEKEDKVADTKPGDYLPLIREGKSLRFYTCRRISVSEFSSKLVTLQVAIDPLYLKYSNSLRFKAFKAQVISTVGNYERKAYEDKLITYIHSGEEVPSEIERIKSREAVQLICLPSTST